MKWLLLLEVIPVSFFIVALYMLARNQWVYKVRIRILHSERGMSKYNKLPSYSAMMNRFWVWDVNKFLDQ